MLFCHILLLFSTAALTFANGVESMHLFAWYFLFFEAESSEIFICDFVGKGLFISMAVS